MTQKSGGDHRTQRFQLGLYTLWAKQQYGKRVYASLVTFNTGNADADYVEFASLKEFDEPTYSRNKPQYGCYNEEYEQALKERIFEVKSKIEQGDFNVNEDADCTWCGFKKICEIQIFSEEEKTVSYNE